MDKVELLVQGIKEYNIELSDEKIKKLFLFKDIVLEYNKVMNLTAIEEEKDFVIKHLIDSMCIIPYIKKDNCKIIDVGTGAGFPGIPLKIVKENANITLMDSLAKKVNFLNDVIKRVGLNNINAIHARAEDLGQDIKHRGKYDFCTARAVASLPVLLEYCLPFVRVEGKFIAMKGISKEEIEKSKKALQILGGKIIEVKEFNLPFTDDKRSLIVVEKIHQTSTKYPRKSGKPSKEPLI